MKLAESERKMKNFSDKEKDMLRKAIENYRDSLKYECDTLEDACQSLPKKTCRALEDKKKLCEEYTNLYYKI